MTASMALADTLNRPLRTLRLSVTDRCNLRCRYCMPEEDYAWLPRDGLLHFEEIERLASRCRFPDCGHEREPGCAVRAAVEAGTIDEARWASYLKLRRELRFLELKKDEKSRRQNEKRTGRDFAARLKEIKKNKLRYR